MIFTNREEGGRRLGRELKSQSLRNPVVLAIPRGGVATGAALAKAIGAELDVVLSRKLRAPFQPEFAIGAIGEDGEVYLDRRSVAYAGAEEAYIEKERRHQVGEIERRRALFRRVRPQASLQGRSVILTDDGIATGATMIAALHVVRAQQPYEVIVAVPVASPDRLEVIRGLCDRVVCLHAPDDFQAVGQFYREFETVEDEDVVRMLKEAPARPIAGEPGAVQAGDAGARPPA